MGENRSPAEHFDVLWIVMPYVFGGVTAIGVLAASIASDWRLYRWWWRSYAICATLLAMGYWASVGAEIRLPDTDKSDILASRWVWLTFSILFPLLSWTSYRNGRTWIVKTAFLQFAFAAACLAWFVYVIVVTGNNVRYGISFRSAPRACWRLARSFNGRFAANSKQR